MYTLWEQGLYRWQIGFDTGIKIRSPNIKQINIGTKKMYDAFFRVIPNNSLIPNGVNLLILFIIIYMC